MTPDTDLSATEPADDMKLFTTDVYQMLKEHQHKLKTIAGSLANSDDGSISLKFNGDNEIYYVNGINKSIAFLLQKAHMSFAPKTQKTKKLSDMRDLLSELEMRQRRLYHEVPICERTITKSELQLGLVNMEIEQLANESEPEPKAKSDSESDAKADDEEDDDEADGDDGEDEEADGDDGEDDEADADDYAVKKEKDLKSLQLNRNKIIGSIKMNHLKLKKLSSEISSTESKMEELEDEISCRVSGIKMVSTVTYDPNYIMAKKALTILNKCNHDSERFLDHLHKYADSFREKSVADILIAEMGDETTFNFRPAKKPFVPYTVAAAPAPVAAAPVAPAPVAPAPAPVAAPVTTRTFGNTDSAKAAPKKAPSRNDRLAAMAAKVKRP